jgi:aspartyl-tRNA(Asn)/glutamyl-tRNA(Gln) amidotransferase subunit A
MDTNQKTDQSLAGGGMAQIHAAAIKEQIGDIATISKRIRDQKTSPIEIVELCLGRIETLNPKLNAFITVLADQALAQAKVAEGEIKASNWRGPLHGIPVGIKDFYDTGGIKTTAAFEPFKDRIPAHDAVGVAKLKKAGAIVIGKMNMHRLGMGTTGLDSCFGPVRNPWNVEFIPGGSSSGSAAALASGLCYATFDTDAIGSCRLPAACCGVIGFKGTYGLINPQGILEGEDDPGEMIRWFSHPAITTRTVEDTALVLDVLAEASKHRAIQYVAGLAQDRSIRIGVADTFRGDREVLEAFEEAVATVRGLGYPVRRVAVPFRSPNDDIRNIEADRRAVAGQTFKDIDVLLVPTTTTTVPAIKDASGNPLALSPENTVFANYYGLPAISVPCGFDVKGLPLGLQIVGKPWDEDTVLYFASRYQTKTRWNTKHPDV